MTPYTCPMGYIIGVQTGEWDTEEKMLNPQTPQKTRRTITMHQYSAEKNPRAAQSEEMMTARRGGDSRARTVDYFLP